MNLILSFFFIFFIFFIGIFPFFILYLFSDFICFLLYRVFGYRKKVILQNLKETLPEITGKEKQKLVHQIYRNLTDIIIEGIKSFVMTSKQVNERHKIINPEILEPYFESGKSIIAVTGHYCNWEWGSLSASLQTKHQVVGFYKPMSNKYIDRFMRWSRSRFGTALASIKETTKTFENFQNQPCIFLMAADQNPSNKNAAIWVDFLGRDTAFLHGPEKHARNNNYTVMYIDIKRVKRGYYSVELSILADNPIELEKEELTNRFAAKLEKTILNKPSNSLWSHKRWKYKRNIES